MREAEIKASILAHVRRASGRRPRPVVAPEFSLGSSCIRADIALWADEFIGIEIKSAGDSLRRLRSQLSAYSRYFDKAILIVAERHLKGIDRGWLEGTALWRVDEKGDVTEVYPAVARGSANAQSFLDLMTQEEIRRFWLPLSQGSDSNVAAREAFRGAFRWRYEKTSGKFWENVRGRKITELDLAALSRFSELRELQQRHLLDRENFWKQWAEQHEQS